MFLAYAVDRPAISGLRHPTSFHAIQAIAAPLYRPKAPAMPVKSTIRLGAILFFLSSILIAGCTAPAVRESSVLAGNVEKIQTLRFVYRHVEMQTTSSVRYGAGASAAETGFEDFGEQLVKQVRAVFQDKRIGVAAAQEIAGRENIPLGPVMIDGKETAVPVLVLTPVSGKVSANRMSTLASYLFSAQIFDPRSRRMVWTASVDTSAWVGQDLVMRRFEKTVYDEEYAVRLLRAILERMIQDGIVT